MRKALAVALAAGLLAGAFVGPAEAGKKKKKPVKTERVAESTYDGPAIGSSDIGGVCLVATNSCGNFLALPEEKYMSVEITDSAGFPVSASVSWDTDGDGISDTGFEVCGKTEEPQEIDPSYEINVFVWALPSPTCPVAIATTGTIKATFSNMP